MISAVKVASGFQLETLLFEYLLVESVLKLLSSFIFSLQVDKFLSVALGFKDGQRGEDGGRRSRGFVPCSTTRLRLLGGVHGQETVVWHVVGVS